MYIKKIVTASEARQSIIRSGLLRLWLAMTICSVRTLREPQGPRIRVSGPPSQAQGPRLISHFLRVRKKALRRRWLLRLLLRGGGVREFRSSERQGR